MAKDIATIIVGLLAYALGILATLKGYGLTIESWPWLIGGTFGAACLTLVAQALKKS